MNFSVLVSVYEKESAKYLCLSLESILSQTLLPTEIILVKDGPLSIELDNVIDRYVDIPNSLFKVIAIDQNLGLGPALNIGLKHCAYDIVARMDSDDICFNTRFETQILYLKKHPEIVALGTYIEEFMRDPKDLGRIKKVPIDPSEVKLYSSKRNPMNHPSVMFRKNFIESVGGYEAVPFFEDYYLWLKLLQKGCKLSNIGLPLLHFRIGNDMIGRRHGYRYALHELRFAKKSWNNGLITFADMLRFVITRFPMRLLPKSLLNNIYKKLIRR
jgi:glycosyltransferase involved in cell wall biosynthesis